MNVFELNMVVLIGQLKLLFQVLLFCLFICNKIVIKAQKVLASNYT